MNEAITIYDARTNLSKYIKKAKLGTPIYIGSYGKKEVVLMAVKPNKKAISFGTSRDKFKYNNSDFKGVDNDIQELFYGISWKRS